MPALLRLEMDMMPTVDSAQSDVVRASFRWCLKERDPQTGLFLPKRRVKNVITNNGLTLLASALSGGYNAPIYLVIDSDGAKLQGSYAAGVTVFQTDKRVDVAGDTQLVLSPGQPSQETVSFSSTTGSGPYTYNLTAPTTQAHNLNDYVLRQVKASDTLANVVSEVQYDSVNFPNQRVQSYSGYSPGAGQWTIQFFVTGTQAVGVQFNTLGISDNPTVGLGTLHNHFILGYTHTSGNDVEIDGTLTLVNG